MCFMSQILKKIVYANRRSARGPTWEKLVTPPGPRSDPISLSYSWILGSTIRTNRWIWAKRSDCSDCSRTTQMQEI